MPGEACPGRCGAGSGLCPETPVAGSRVPGPGFARASPPFMELRAWQPAVYLVLTSLPAGHTRGRSRSSWPLPVLGCRRQALPPGMQCPERGHPWARGEMSVPAVPAIPDRNSAPPDLAPGWKAAGLLEGLGRPVPGARAKTPGPGEPGEQEIPRPVRQRLWSAGPLLSSSRRGRPRRGHADHLRLLG